VLARDLRWKKERGVVPSFDRSLLPGTCPYRSWTFDPELIIANYASGRQSD
jgi:hypothetical protein